jgi:hypothetical protein
MMSAIACSSNKSVSNTGRTTTNTQEKRKAVGQSGPPSIDDIFKMVANNDGKLSKPEVKGPLLEDFSTIDTDNDGFISRTELENVPKPKRRSGRRLN